jgi:hypothetical protein
MLNVLAISKASMFPVFMIHFKIAGNSQAGTRGEHSRDVLQESTSGNVRHSLEHTGSDGGQELFDVDPGRDQEGLTEGDRSVPRSGRGVFESRSSDDLADERESVRVDTGRGETYEDVASLDVGLRQEQLALDRTDGESGQVVII